MTAGLRKLCCKVCGKESEVETGIKSLYCCAQKMTEVEEEAVTEEQEPPTLKLKPRR